MKTKKSALGRGLSAILESPETDITSNDISGSFVVGAVANIRLEKIEANPFQPRNTIEEKSLNELAVSIREQGIIQPVTVRKLGFDKYQLISGERRYRAARLAELKDIPAFIRVANDLQMLEMALIENIHREDLNSLDIAISYRRLLDECKITHEELSERIGKGRTTIVNYIRLLKLPPQIQIALRDNRISMGHARALINVENEEIQIEILNKAILNDLSVREIERLVKENNNRKNDFQRKVTSVLPEKYKTIQNGLSTNFNTKVKIRRNNKGKGSIVIPFNTEKEFYRIIEIIEK